MYWRMWNIFCNFAPTYSFIQAMKKVFALLMIGSILTLGVTGCFPDGPDKPSVTSGDENLAGVAVTAGDPGNAFYKLFVLNEGQMGTNGAELDFLRFTDGKFVNSAYSQMNAGKKLGDVANDIYIRGNLAWIVVNNSGLIEVINAIDETSYVHFDIPAPRNISFYGNYAYVTSWAEAASTPLTDGTGAVYRIDLVNASVDPVPMEVGWQPEGIVTDNAGYIWVANSGGIHAMATGAYDDRLMVINPSSQQVATSINLAANLKNLFYDTQHGIIWATALGDYYSVHSGVYPVSVSNRTPISRSEELAAVRFSCAAFDSEWNLVVVGSDDEWNWSGPRAYSLARVSPDGTVRKTPFAGTDAERIASPYAIAVHPVSGDIYITDAGDYINPGKLWCFDGELKLKWEATTGVCPGHLAFYAIYW